MQPTERSRHGKGRMLRQGVYGQPAGKRPDQGALYHGPHLSGGFLLRRPPCYQGSSTAANAERGTMANMGIIPATAASKAHRLFIYAIQI